MVFAVTLPFLNEVVTLFIVSVTIAYICYRLQLVPIVGFLIAGAIIGPNALGLVDDQELVNVLAEIGVILLLFTIGLEFSLETLIRIRNAILVGGGAQVTSVTLLVAGLLLWMDVPIQTGIYTGFLVALSSTAIILGILNERSETETPTGQLSLAVLIFQDLAIIVMVLLVPMLAGTGGATGSILLALLKAGVLIVMVLILARKVVPWILEKVAQTRRQDLFLLTVVAICFGTAAFTNLAGVSLALGAFLAGLVVSESQYSDQALSEILPLRTVFNAVFFVSVGMLLNVSVLLDNPGFILAVAVGVIIIKFITATGSLLTLGYPIRISAAAGLIVAQIGEFSFVLERVGRSAGLYPGGMGPEGSQVFIAVSVLLMLVTPFKISKSSNVGNLISGWLMSDKPSGKRNQKPSERSPALEDHVVIVGYGPAGRRLVQVLKDTGIPFVVIEMNPKSADEMKREGIPAVYGDASRSIILEKAHIEKAKLCVVAINDPQATPRITQQARFQNPTLQIISRARFLGNVEQLEKAGSDIVVAEEMETTVRIFSHVLAAYMIPDEEIEKYAHNLRNEDYKIMRGSIQEAHLMVLQGLDDEGLHTRAVAVREGAPVAGKTLKEVELRKKYNLTVLAIRRGNTTIGSPSAEIKILPDDRLIMIGEAKQFIKCSDLFRVNSTH
jgi:CPA2 family monovalent cation:H+ antiporter-2